MQRNSACRFPPTKRRLPDSEEEVAADQLVLLRPPLALLPGLLVGAARQEVLEDVAARQHGVAGHVVHPPDQTLASLGDEVLLEAARRLLLRQAGHRDDGEALHQPAVQPVEVLVPGWTMEEGGRGLGVFERGNLKELGEIPTDGSKKSSLEFKCCNDLRYNCAILLIYIQMCVYTYLCVFLNFYM